MEKELYIIGGPNGAGKTTSAFVVAPDFLRINEFVNADEIAKGLSPFNVEAVAYQSGKIMLERIEDLISDGKSFAIETTCSGNGHGNLIKKCQKLGYKVTLLFLWLQSDELAVSRVEERVKQGGHSIPVKTIQRRYIRGIKNLVNMYIPLCDKVIIYDTSYPIESEDPLNPFCIIAKKQKDAKIEVMDKNLWNITQKVADGAKS